VLKLYKPELQSHPAMRDLFHLDITHKLVFIYLSSFKEISASKNGSMGKSGEK
jgi:hypothetical protein